MTKVATYALRIESSCAIRRLFSARCSGVTSGKSVPSAGGTISSVSEYVSPGFLSRTSISSFSFPKDSLPNPKLSPFEAHTNISPLPAVNETRPASSVRLVATE